MGNKVFANGREVSCKAGKAKSICAFPDVCMTPPENPATPPGVPIPYPNTGMSSDTSSGSKKVKISKKEVMLKNQSFYKKSTGDEAGSAAKKGVITSTNRGKVYFIIWSMDVKVEGKNAVRHLDMTTHNHMSPPGNSPPMVNAESMAPPGGKGPCDHAWSLEMPKKSKGADEKKKDLLATGNTGDAFEAAAADHNDIKDGDDMSGTGKDSKIFAKCSDCGKQVEIDHVTRDEDGNLDAIVECKSGNAMIKAKQMRDRSDIAAKLGIKAKYKLESGPGADKGESFLTGKGWDPANVIQV